MRPRRRGFLSALSALLTLSVAAVATAPVARAQSSDAAGQALCETITAEELGELLGGRYRPEPGFESCVWNLESPYYVNAFWQRSSLEDVKSSWTPGTDVSVGGRPGWLASDSGTLFVEVDGGVLGLTILGTETEGLDLDEALMSLGEQLAGRVGSLPALATPEPVDGGFGLGHADPDLEARFPETVGGQPLFLQSMTGPEFLGTSVDDTSMRQLEAALAAQGKTMDDVSIGLGSSADGSGILAIRLRGGDARPLGDLFLSFVAGGSDVEPEPVELGGKDVTAITSGGVSSYVYSSGEVVWVVTAVEPGLSEILAALP
jgi:hypothetical protein